MASVGRINGTPVILPNFATNFCASFQETLSTGRLGSCTEEGLPPITADQSAWLTGAVETA